MNIAVVILAFPVPRALGRHIRGQLVSGKWMISDMDLAFSGVLDAAETIK